MLHTAENVRELCMCVFIDRVIMLVDFKCALIVCGFFCCCCFTKNEEVS